MGLSFPIILAVTAVVSWWLSSYDSMVTGENSAGDLRRRIIRSGVTVLLVGIAIGSLSGTPRFSGFIAIAMVVPIALIWVGCASEFMARSVHRLIDSPSAPESDPEQVVADLNRLARLFEEGRNEDAIKLCTKLLNAGEGSALAIEAMLFRLYDRMFSDDRLRSSPVLAEVNHLAAGGYVAEAESRVTALMKRQPAELAPVLFLMRLYARNLNGAEKAYALVQDLELRSGIPPFFASYCRQRIAAWLAPASPETEGDEGIESLLVDKTRLNRSGGADRPSQV